MLGSLNQMHAGVQSKMQDWGMGGGHRDKTGSLLLSVLLALAGLAQLTVVLTNSNSMFVKSIRAAALQ